MGAHMVRKLEQLIPSIVVIFLPFLMAIYLDVTPYSKTIETHWQSLDLNKKVTQTEKWIEIAHTILRQQPWQANLWIRLAEKQFQNGDLDDAIHSFKVADSIASLSVDQTILLGQVYWDANQLENAYATWQTIINQKDLRAEDLRALVQIQQSKNDWFGAYQTLLKWKEIDPENKDLVLPMALSQIIFEPEAAVTTITNSNNRKIQSLLPEIEIIIKEENPVFELVLSGNLLASIGEWDYASAAYAYATRLDPEYAEGWALYGNALINSGKDGISALNKALTISPQSIIARAYLASYWRSQSDFERSLEMYQDLSSEEPEQAIWQQELGNTYIQAGNVDKALQAFVNTTKIEPGNSYYWINLARFCGEYKVEIQEIGLPAARQALLIDEKNWEAFDTLGWLFLLLEDYTSAERFLTSAYKEAPESALVNLHLGQLFYFQNKAQLSSYFLKRCIEFAENDALIQLANKFLSP
jgi:tetratricopeptide (TPR) repeat protein